MSLSVFFTVFPCLSFFQKALVSPLPSVWVGREKNTERLLFVHFEVFEQPLFCIKHLGKQQLAIGNLSRYHVWAMALVSLLVFLEKIHQNNRRTWWKRVRKWKKTRGVKKTKRKYDLSRALWYVFEMLFHLNDPETEFVIIKNVKTKIFLLSGKTPPPVCFDCHGGVIMSSLMRYWNMESWLRDNMWCHLHMKHQI